MMNAIFKRFVITSFCVTVSGGCGMAQEISDIVWTREDRSDACINFKFDMPASLVPLFSAGTPAAEPQWTSFDKKMLFWYSTNPFHLELTTLSRAEYIRWGRCLRSEKRASKCWESDRILAKARVSEGNGYGEGSANCLEVDAVAPSKSNDRSRFGAMIQLCGPAADRNLIRASVDKILHSLEISYTGCCRPHDNLAGCI